MYVIDLRYQQELGISLILCSNNTYVISSFSSFCPNCSSCAFFISPFVILAYASSRTCRSIQLILLWAREIKSGGGLAPVIVSMQNQSVDWTDVIILWYIAMQWRHVACMASSVPFISPRIMLVQLKTDVMSICESMMIGIPGITFIAQDGSHDL